MFKKIQNIKEAWRRVYGRPLRFFYARFICERSDNSKCRKYFDRKLCVSIGRYGDRKGGNFARNTVYIWE